MLASSLFQSFLSLPDPRLEDSIADMVLWDLDAIYAALSTMMDARSVNALGKQPDNSLSAGWYIG
jgi:hypothetical protein